MTMRRVNQQGFTLVELLIAMAVFSFMLVIITSGFITLMRMSQSGTAARATQQNVRLVSETIERKVRGASVVRVVDDMAAHNGRKGSYTKVCMYYAGQYWVYGVDAGGVLRQSTDAGSGADPLTAVCARTVNDTWSAVTDSSVRVTHFSASVPGSATGGSVRTGQVMSLDIALTGSYVADAELTDDGRGCVPQTGSQFCNVTSLVTSAELRGGTEL